MLSCWGLKLIVVGAADQRGGQKEKGKPVGVEATDVQLH
jgi:hypothetical protein